MDMAPIKTQRDYRRALKRIEIDCEMRQAIGIGDCSRATTPDTFGEEVSSGDDRRLILLRDLGRVTI